MGIPRIRVKIGQAEEPEECKGKWFFTMWLTEIGGGEGIELGTWGPWESKTKAEEEAKTAARIAVESIEKKMTGSISGKVIDMTDNSVKTWAELKPGKLKKAKK